MQQEIIIALSGMIGGIFTAAITTLPDYIKARKDSTKHDAVNIKAIYAPVFAYLDEMESFFITRYTGYDPGRTALIREQAVHMIRIWRPILEKAAQTMDECYGKDKSNDLAACNKVYNVFQKAYTEAIQAYVEWHKADYVYSVMGTLYTEKDRATMDVFMSEFKKWSSPKEEMIKVGTHDISLSKISPDCMAKTWDILLVWQLALLNIKLDLEKTDNELNGSLTGLEFLGLTVGPCRKELNDGRDV